MTTIYLAFSGSGGGKKTMGAYREAGWDEFGLGILVAFPYLKQAKSMMERIDIQPDCWMLDSGAFSAWSSGKTIDIEALTEETKNPFWTESVALDVIGDAEGSLKNALRMKEHGSPAFPVHHVGEPLEILDEYCANFEKVGLSCRFGEGVPDSMTYLTHCFARHWPKQFHSFGWVTPEVLKTFPFHTADTATWNNGPCRWGNWGVAFGRRLPVNGNRDLRAMVDGYKKMQREARWRWRAVLQNF